MGNLQVYKYVQLSIGTHCHIMYAHIYCTDTHTRTHTHKLYKLVASETSTTRFDGLTTHHGRLKRRSRL